MVESNRRVSTVSQLTLYSNLIRELYNAERMAEWLREKSKRRLWQESKIWR